MIDSETQTNKYLVFHYNCWQYDYYEESIVAIISSILDQIDRNINNVNQELKNKAKVVLKLIAKNLIDKVKGRVSEETGIDFKEIEKIINESKEISNEEKSKAQEFDTYADLTKAIELVSKMLVSFANDQTIIFVVDELDRCLPNYAIKVLERLHHIFYKRQNIQVVFAVDKKQLENTIRQIYGNNVSVSGYLEKFIDFELILDNGILKQILQGEYTSYYCDFSDEYNQIDVIVGKCESLLQDIPIRKTKAIIKRSNLCHQLVNTEGKINDSVFLVIEIFLTILNVYGLDVEQANKNYYLDELFESTESAVRRNNKIFAYSVQELKGMRQWKNIYLDHENKRKKEYDPDYPKKYLIIETDIVEGILLGCLRYIIGYGTDYWNFHDEPIEKITKSYIVKYITEFWSYLEIVK